MSALKDKTTTKEEKKKILRSCLHMQTTIHHQLSSACLWSVSVFGIRRLGVCPCCYRMVVFVWKSQCRLEHQRLSVALFPHYCPLLPRCSLDLLHCHSPHKYLALFTFCTDAQTRKRRACDVPAFTWTTVFIASNISTVPGIKIEKCWARVAQLSVSLPPPLFHYGYQCFYMGISRDRVRVFTSTHNKRFLPSTCWR